MAKGTYNLITVSASNILAATVEALCTAVPIYTLTALCQGPLWNTSKIMHCTDQYRARLLGFESTDQLWDLEQVFSPLCGSISTSGKQR